MRIRPLTLAVLAAATCTAASAADLVSVYNDALAYDAQFAAARAQRLADDEKLVQGRAGLLPVIGASANSTYNQVETRQPVSRDSNFNSNGYSLQLTQPLFRWQNWVAYKQGELQVALAEAQYQQARQDLIVRVAQAYFDVLVAEEALASLEAQKKAAAEQLELAKKSFEVGTVTITDVHEAQSRYDLAVAQEIAAQSDLEVRRQVLTQVTGKPQGALEALTKEAQLPQPEPADITAWSSSAEQNAYAVQAAQTALEIAAREVERNRAGHYPTVDLVATHGRNKAFIASNGFNSDSTTSTLGLQLNVPLYQGGAVSSRERETAALQVKARADLDNARRSAVLAAQQSYLGVSSGLAQVKALEAAQVSSQSALDANRLGYEVGVRINIDVLNALQQVYATRRDLARARYDTLLAQLRLKAAAGSLSAADLEAVNALLD